MPGVTDDNRTVAAVDLGSNSFHMIVAQGDRSGFTVVDRIKERVRLASGLSKKGRMHGGVGDRAVACLERFGQRLRDLPRGAVRTVGTNTFRQVRDGGSFLERCETALGRRIEIISGDEEARLVYRGVAHDVTHRSGGHDERRLVVDIGGGSTECVVGEARRVVVASSLYMGCVTYTARWFPGGRLSKSRMSDARIAAGNELEPIVRRVADADWSVAVGSSGTALAIRAALEANGWSKGRITAAGLRRLRKEIQSAKEVERLRIEGISDQRTPVIAGGVAIMQAVFDAFDVDEMDTSPAAVREGVVLGLLGVPGHEDARDATVAAMQERYGVDVEHARRVERTALALFEHVADAWKIAGADNRRLLAWAARLHEIGLSVSRPGYQRHSAYLIRWSDMPGFSRGEQGLLAAVVRAHRRKAGLELFEELPKEDGRLARCLCVLLRLARRLNRSRGPRPPVPASVEPFSDGLTVTFREGWLEEHPLTAYDLYEEARRVAQLDVRLVVG